MRPTDKQKGFFSEYMFIVIFRIKNSVKTREFKRSRENKHNTCAYTTVKFGFGIITLDTAMKKTVDISRNFAGCFRAAQFVVVSWLPALCTRSGMVED